MKSTKTIFLGKNYVSGAGSYRKQFGTCNNYDADTIDLCLERFSKYTNSLSHELSNVTNRNGMYFCYTALTKNIYDLDSRHIAEIIHYYIKHCHKFGDFVDAVATSTCNNHETTFNLHLLVRIMYELIKDTRLNAEQIEFIKKCPGINDSFGINSTEHKDKNKDKDLSKWTDLSEIVEVKQLREQIECQQLKLDQLHNDFSVIIDAAKLFTVVFEFIKRLIIETLSCFRELFAIVYMEIYDNFMILLIVVLFAWCIVTTFELRELRDHVNANTAGFRVLINRQFHNIV